MVNQLSQVTNYYRTRFVTASFLIGSCMDKSVSAQQKYIPGVTDITSMTAVSTPDSVAFVRFIKKACQDSTHFIKQVKDCSGGVEYREDLKSYVISYGVPNTWDNQVTAILCNCSQASKWLGRSVIFSGRYYRALGVRRRYAGENIVYLYMTSIR